MKIKHFVIFTFLILSISSLAQNNDFGDWSQKIKKDDFGDLEDYSYDYLAYDKFNSNYVYIRVEKVGLGIYKSDDGQNFIGIDRTLMPYTIKIKDASGNIYDDMKSLVSDTGIIFKENSNLYQLLTHSTGKKFSVVIYNNLGKRVNSFDVTSFEPNFK